MKIHLDYHRDGLDVDVPERNLAGIIARPEGREAGDEGELLARALGAPMGAAPLAQLARGRRSACVVIPDSTRPLPNRLVLPPVLEALEQGGIARTAILILVATGLHRPNTPAELEEMVGPEIFGRCRIVDHEKWEPETRESQPSSAVPQPIQLTGKIPVLQGCYRIANHVARDAASHVALGVTSTGVPIHADRRYCESELKIVLGLVEPHFMAGFSGGRKLICPGICAEETIRRFHSPELIEHPRSANLVIEENPTHRTSTEAARLAGVDFSVNVVIDAQRRIVGAFAGDVEAAFEAAAACAAGRMTVPIAEPADILVVTGGGYPLDATWYQSIKGLVAAIPGVKRGGTILMATGLSEGVGTADFARLLDETCDLEAFMRQIREPGFYRDEQWQLEKFVLAARHARILLYSDALPREVQRGFFVEPVESVEAGLAMALEAHGPEASVLVMPHGPYLLPACGGGLPD